MSAGLDDVKRHADLMRRQRLYLALESARRVICAYGQDPCDCKYGIDRDVGLVSERTGCPELRDLIREWTGWSPFNRGQTITADLAAFAEKEAAVKP